MKTSVWDRHQKLIILLSASTILLLLWSFVIPVFEAPDEPHHWRYALYLHKNWRLPLYTPELAEANSPPLYYLLISPLASDTSEPATILDSALQSPAPPRWFDDSSKDLSMYWSIRSARIATVVLSVLTVFFCYLTGLEATNSTTTGLLTGGLIAFLPQFTFRGMNISNDALVTLMCAITTYLIVRLIRRGFTWRIALLAAITSALAFLSKTTAIFLPIPLGITILTEQVTWKSRLERLFVLGITGVLIVAPWLVRNQILYGDPLASRIMLTVVAHIVDIKPLLSPYFLTAFPLNLFLSVIGDFGWMNLRLPNWIYLFFVLIILLSVAGYIWRCLQHKIDNRLTLILFLFPFLSLAVTVYINLTFTQPQGRYLFPALAATAVLMGFGFEGLPFWSRRLTYSLLGVLFLLNLYIVGTVILPAYWL
jgi:4-amino-4-deoxy-L-arabinose transferase-like glycosyltransferase